MERKRGIEGRGRERGEEEERSPQVATLLISSTIFIYPVYANTSCVRIASIAFSSVHSPIATTERPSRDANSCKLTYAYIHSARKHEREMRNRKKWEREKRRE